MPSTSIQAQDVFDIIDRGIKWVSPFIAIIASLVVFVYRSHAKELNSKIKELETKIKEEETDRKEDINDVKNMIETQYKLMRKMEETILTTFKEGLREERSFRSDVSLKQGDQIEKICSRLEELSRQFSRLDEKVLNHMENQEKICRFHLMTPGHKE